MSLTTRIEQCTQNWNSDARSAVSVGHVGVVVQGREFVHIDDGASARCECSGRCWSDDVDAREPKAEGRRCSCDLRAERGRDRGPQSVVVLGTVVVGDSLDTQRRPCGKDGLERYTGPLQQQDAVEVDSERLEAWVP